MQAFIADYFQAIVDKFDIQFKPHFTIAYRDLTPEMFTKAWRNINTNSLMHRLKWMLSIYCNMIQRSGILLKQKIYRRKLFLNSRYKNTVQGSDTRKCH